MVTLPQATFSSCGLPAALSETPVLSACAASGHLSPVGAVLGELPLSSPYSRAAFPRASCPSLWLQAQLLSSEKKTSTWKPCHQLLLALRQPSFFFFFKVYLSSGTCSVPV